MSRKIKGPEGGKFREESEAMSQRHKESRPRSRAAMDDRIAEIVRKNFRCEDLIFHSILSMRLLQSRKSSSVERKLAEASIASRRFLSESAIIV